MSDRTDDDDDERSRLAVQATLNLMSETIDRTVELRSENDGLRELIRTIGGVTATYFKRDVRVSIHWIPDETLSSSSQPDDDNKVYFTPEQADLWDLIMREDS